VNSQLKILFLLQDLPYPVSDGMRWKVFHLLRYLSSRHRCDVIAFSSDDKPDLTALRRELPAVNWLGAVPATTGFLRWVKAGIALLSGKPVSLARFQNPAFSQNLKAAVARCPYDVVHYDIVNMAQHLVVGIPSVHSPNDATSLFYMRMAANASSWLVRMRLMVGAALLRRYERCNYPKFTKIHVVSKIDADFLRLNVPAADVVFIPFGVAEVDAKPDISGVGTQVTDSNLVLVLGGANVPGVAAGIEEFIHAAIPVIARRYPSAKFRIQGRETDILLPRIGKLTANVTGSTWVDDLDALIRAAAVIVLPDKAGTGIKTRALDALSCGAAVVGTTVAFEGIREYVKNGQHCVIVDSMSSLANEVLALLEDPPRRHSLGAEASQLVRNELSWSRLGPEYEKLYRTAAESSSSTFQKSVT